MTKTTKTSAQGSDWTRLLTDPDLVSHLSTLLQTYREVAPQEREAALLRAMREIKETAVAAREGEGKKAAPATASLQSPEPITETPPFEPVLFTSQAPSDRREFTRMKCCVAVEIHIEGVKEPVWGNLSNVSRGGCLVETASSVPPNKALEIGLWLASGQIWVKGVVINGVATRITPSYGTRVKFSEAELSEKEHLREFLKFVEGATRKSQGANVYVAKLKA
jgi:hypothetical protein